MGKVVVKEYAKDDYKEFFEWLLDREVNINEMIDISLLDVYNEPKVYYPDEIKKLLETEAMQRLKRVTQLGSSLLIKDDDFQTRFAHSVGAGNNAQHFFIKLFKENPEWKHAIEKYGKKEEILADIIQMYVHDIGHNVLSHTLENLIKSYSPNKQSGAAHEILGKRIINKDEEIRQVFDEISPTFLDTFNRVTLEDYDLRSLKEGSIDFDRLDYLIRDKMYVGDYEDRDITEKLIKYYDIVVQEKDGELKQIPVLDVKGKRDIRDFLERRKSSYINNYHSNQSIAFEKIAIYFCEKIASGNYECDLKDYIVDCQKKGGNRIDLNEYKKWDDTRFYSETIKIAQNHPDEDMRELAIHCLPSLRGLTNFLFEAYDLDNLKSEDELTNSEKEFYNTVKDLVKNDSELHRKLLAKQGDDIVFLNAQNKDDIDNLFEELNQAGIDSQKLDSLISWNKTIILYNQKDPINLKNSRDQIRPLEDYIVFSDERDNHEVNGVLALPMQMKENGFSIEEINMVQNTFRRYNKEHSKKQEKLPSTLMDSMDCVNNLREDREL